MGEIIVVVVVVGALVYLVTKLRAREKTGRGSGKPERPDSEQK